MIDEDVEGLEMSNIALSYGLKREFLAAFIKRSDKGSVSNSAGISMTWRKV